MIAFGFVPDVLIREVPVEDLDQIRVAAAAQGRSLQSYLKDAVRDQAAYLRRQAALARTGERLRGRPTVGEPERDGVLEAIDEAHAQRAEQLGGPPTS